MGRMCVLSCCRFALLWRWPAQCRGAFVCVEYPVLGQGDSLLLSEEVVLIAEQTPNLPH